MRYPHEMTDGELRAALLEEVTQELASTRATLLPAETANARMHALLDELVRRRERYETNPHPAMVAPIRSVTREELLAKGYTEEEIPAGVVQPGDHEAWAALVSREEERYLNTGLLPPRPAWWRRFLDWARSYRLDW